MNLVHFFVKLYHFYSCTDYGINYTKRFTIDKIIVDSELSDQVQVRKYGKYYWLDRSKEKLDGSERA